MMREGGGKNRSSKAALQGNKTMSKSARDMRAAKQLKTSSEKQKLQRNSTFNAKGDKKGSFFSGFGKKWG
jgi:hypothetical protein